MNSIEAVGELRAINPNWSYCAEKQVWFHVTDKKPKEDYCITVVEPSTNTDCKCIRFTGISFEQCFIQARAFVTPGYRIPATPNEE